MLYNEYIIGTRMILKNKYFGNPLFLLMIIFFSCVPSKNKEENIIIIGNIGGWDGDESKDKFGQIITFDTGISSVSNDTSKILLKTRDGSSQTGFNLKEKFYNDYKSSRNLIIISTIDDLQQVQNDYFDLSFLDTFSSEFFINNYLCFVISYYTGSWYPKDERIKIINENYIFEIDYWSRSSDDKRVYVASAFTILYVLEIPK
jgi:hypothetical protein